MKKKQLVTSRLVIVEPKCCELGIGGDGVLKQ